jgi:hypothetical protein
VDGVETDSKYPALLTLQDGKLTPVYGTFSGIATTGAEIFGGVSSGSLTITNVTECVICMDSEANVSSPFAVFATKSYERKKQSEKGSIPYILAKLLLNSCYGKFIQSSKPQLLGSDCDEFICQYPAGDEANYAKLYLDEYAKALAEGEDPLDALEDLRDLIVSETIAAGLKLEMKPYNRMSTNKQEFAPSAIPAAAALITAFSRARLRALIKCTGAVYWDTDSAFIAGKTEAEIGECFKVGNAWIAPGLVPLEWGNELGQLDLEIDGAKGWLAGTKRYYLYGADDKGKQKLKSATHGIVNIHSPYSSDKIKARYSEVAIRNLATGRDVRYRTKAAPLKAKGTKNADVGWFESRRVAPSFKLDERQHWTKADDGTHWLGHMKTWEELLNESG